MDRLGASELGLEGAVERDQLHAVLAGRDPRTDVPLRRLLRKDRLPGFDVTFSVPKSFSVLWATADERTARLIRDAHERAVEAALGFLEREASFTRLGTDGHTAARGAGFVAAAFRHRMSRAGDPQLPLRPRRQLDPHARRQVANARRPAPLPPRQDRRLPLPG
jgi:conjugative relaxase-like TrwC/TraI family protein